MRISLKSPFELHQVFLWFQINLLYHLGGNVAQLIILVNHFLVPRFIWFFSLRFIFIILSQQSAKSLLLLFFVGIGFYWACFLSTIFLCSFWRKRFFGYNLSLFIFFFSSLQLIWIARCIIEQHFILPNMSTRIIFLLFIKISILKRKVLELFFFIITSFKLFLLWPVSAVFFITASLSNLQMIILRIIELVTNNNFISIGIVRTRWHSFA